MVLQAISKILSDETLLNGEAELLNDYEPSEIAAYRFVPIISCEVERVFLRFIVIFFQEIYFFPPPCGGVRHIMVW